MKNILLLALILLSTSSVWAISPSVLEESLYMDFKSGIVEKGIDQPIGLTSFEQKLYVDALWDLASENSESAFKTLHSLNTEQFDLLQRLRLAILMRHFPKRLVRQLTNALLAPEVDINLLFTLAGHQDILLEFGLKKIINLAKKHPRYEEALVSGLALGSSILRDLFYLSPAVDGVKIYMFCRQNRIYPCLMVMRDIDDNIVTNSNGTLWTHKALASSARGLPSNVRNGDTPAGVLLINSVMPDPDQPLSFGKYRRLILDFIPASENEQVIKDLLPASSHDQIWWRPNVVAREVGRDLLRIHGSGKLNLEPTTPWFPFMRTSGCISQRENIYENVTYQDQRDLLDMMMSSMNLPVTYENETQLKGVLYLVEIDNAERAVTQRDLRIRGIRLR